MTEQEVQTQEQETSAEQAAPSLTLQDLVLVAQIIQIGSQRGTFRAEELADVGTLYTKLIAFLQATGALAPAKTEETKND
jgi:hypothetical protein